MTSRDTFCIKAGMSKKPFTTHREIIDAIGIDVLVQIFSVEHPKTLRPHVRQMRNRNSIPVDFWDETVKAARKAGVSGVTTTVLQATRPAPKPKGVKKLAKRKAKAA